jgi:tRNA-2-methylthio-N6-dimethylallyladenosine synthase
MMIRNLKITVITPEFYSYGALLITGILKEQGYTVKLQKGFGKVVDADIVFISLQSTIHLMKYQQEISSINAFKIVGGPVTLTPELILECLPVDLVVVGEGENTVYNILKFLETHPSYQISDFKDIPGVAFKVNDQIVSTAPDESPHKRPLPFIPDDIAHENIRGANIYLETHRGCPGNCGFCGVPSLFGRNVRSRPLDEILNEVKYMLSKGAQRIAISGGTGSLYGSKKFKTVDEESFVELLHEISKLTGPKNLIIPDVRVDLVSDEILEAIKQYSRGWVFFGIESGSDRVLRHMKKGITVDQVYEAVEMARNHGVKIGGSFIVAYPGEEEEDYQDTVDLADELMLNDYFVSIAEPIPGTPLGEEVSQLPLEDNLLFQESSKYKRYGFSIAEERALDLMVDSYIFRTFPTAMSQKLLKDLQKEVKSQGEHIKSVIHLLKNQCKS